MKHCGRMLEAEHVLARGSSLQQAALQIDRNCCGAVCVTDEHGRLMGVLTDGDLRRQVLKGVELDKVVLDEVMQRRPVSATPDFTRSQLRHLMKARSIAQIPIVDSTNRLLGLALASDLLEAPAKGRQALIMAGGKGLRLRPLTLDKPKPLLHVGGRPILEHIIERLVANGFDRIHVSVGYRSTMIEDCLQDGSQLGANIRYLREEHPLGTAGALRLLPGDVEGDLLVMNGDILTTLDFASMLESHVAAGAEMTVAVREIVQQIDFGVVRVEEEWIRALDEKPRQSALVNAGIYILGDRIRRLLPPEGPCDMTELIQWGLGEGRRIKSYPLREFWLDIGRRADYEAARHFNLEAPGTLGPERSESAGKLLYDSAV